MRFPTKEEEDAALELVDSYMEPPDETEPMECKVAIEAERWGIYGPIYDDLTKGNRSLEDIRDELSRCPSFTKAAW